MTTNLQYTKNLIRWVNILLIQLCINLNNYKILYIVILYILINICCNCGLIGETIYCENSNPVDTQNLNNDNNNNISSETQNASNVNTNSNTNNANIPESKDQNENKNENENENIDDKDDYGFLLYKPFEYILAGMFIVTIINIFMSLPRPPRPGGGPSRDPWRPIG